MYDKGKVITGIVVFVIFFTSPFLIGLVRHGPAPEPELSPKAKQAKQCVESKAYMTEYHMQLLDQWRNAAVRQAERVYLSSTGKHYTVSLQNTCLECHSNKSKFCDKCHNYMDVTPYCWECHIEPKETK
ncbi:MAG: sulfate reduction electron transfer complex DsrMKJOP subunit DsrJ [Deltaproteobacteria bacterium]|nr:sulfate reduction electron transfer complex DsrMKJOP subunit DsrJ [Deltaproteobacteria bacterium]MBW2071027.1 sulfate reduction electron transfer complex DsrMKJOP subunit DsrJ [Deltaproteobacteria bacterium]